MRELNIVKKSNKSLQLIYKFQTKSLAGFLIEFDQERPSWKRKYVRIQKRKKLKNDKKGFLYQISNYKCKSN